MSSMSFYIQTYIHTSVALEPWKGRCILGNLPHFSRLVCSLSVDRPPVHPSTAHGVFLSFGSRTLRPNNPINFKPMPNAAINGIRLMSISSAQRSSHIGMRRTPFSIILLRLIAEFHVCWWKSDLKSSIAVHSPSTIYCVIVTDGSAICLNFHTNSSLLTC